MIPIYIQVSRSNVKVISHVSLPHIVQLITQERFAPELGQRAGTKVRPTLLMLGKGALVFYKQLYLRIEINTTIRGKKYVSLLSPDRP